MTPTMLLTGLLLLSCAVPAFHSCDWLNSLCVISIEQGLIPPTTDDAVPLEPDLLPGVKSIQWDGTVVFSSPYGAGLVDPEKSLKPPMAWR